jgi:hypothetical protein
VAKESVIAPTKQWAVSDRRLRGCSSLKKSRNGDGARFIVAWERQKAEKFHCKEAMDEAEQSCHCAKQV